MKGPILACALLAVLMLSLVGSRPSAAQGESHVVASYTLLGGGTSSSPVFWFFSNGQNVSTFLTTTPTNYTVDSGMPWGVSKVLPNSTLAQRWQVSGPNTGVGGNNTVVVFPYYRQYFANFGMPVIPKAGLFAPPQVNYTQFGVQKSTIAGRTAWADYNSSYTYADVNGTQPGVRWFVKAPTGVVLNAFKITPHYYEQFQTAFSLGTLGHDTLQSTTLTATYGGAATAFPVPAPGVTYWLDANTTLSFPSLLDSSSGGHRWVLHSVSSTSVPSPLSVAVSYYEQFPITVSYTISAGIAPSAPAVSGVSNGRQYSQQMFSPSPPAWVDAGSSYSVSTLLLGSTSQERWVTFSPTSGVADAPASLTYEYFHQVLVNFSYSVIGGGTVAPSITYTYRGNETVTAVGGSPGSVWADYNTELSVQGAFQGGSSQERWQLKSASQLVLLTPLTLSYAYYHQYDVPVTYNMPDGPQGLSPEFVGSSLGVTFASQLTTGNSFWLDSGSRWSESSVIPGATGERWLAVGDANGTVDSPQSVDSTYAHEYYLTIGANSQSAGEYGQSAWVRAGGQVQLTASPGEGWAFERWSGSGNGSFSGTATTHSITLLGPVQETAYFDLAYTVRVFGAGTVQMSVGTSTYTVGRNPIVLYLVPGTQVTMAAQPAILQSFLGWQGIPGGQAGTVVISATSPTNVEAVFGLNMVEAYGLVALYFGVAVYVIAYIFWRRRPSTSGLLGRLRRQGGRHV